MDIKTDINLSGPQFSLAVSMFFVGTCVADLFTNIGMRYVRPSLYLAGAMVGLIPVAICDVTVLNGVTDHLGRHGHTPSSRGRTSRHVRD
jgi:uncharacterized membrane protein YjjP (DUF1212 family)